MDPPLTQVAAQLQGWQRRVELALAARLPPADAAPAHLHQALRYSVLNAGSRLPAALVYAAAQTAGVATPAVDDAACAVELALAGCRIHDALPPLGVAGPPHDRKPCHEAYDEATALLVGDALLPLAIRILAGEPSPATDPAVRLRLVALLAEASGSGGAVGGQALQLAARAESPAATPPADLPLRRTALGRAAVMMGAACAPHIDPPLQQALQRFAGAIGPAVYRCEASPPGAVEAASQALVRGAREAVDQALAPLGGAAEALRQLAAWVLAPRA